MTPTLRRTLPAAVLAASLAAGCGLIKSQDYDPEGPGAETQSLPEARAGFQTRLASKERDGSKPDAPPAKLFRLVKFDSPAGKLHAYITPDPGDNRKRPAIVWITGGDCNTIGKGCFEEGSVGNDQSACSYRKAGMVMMFPSMRGGNDNPGYKEGFFGEVDDVLAAVEFLAKQDHVDPKRIYLGGHSTGGTLALLVAAAAPEGRFRAVFSFGPAADPLRDYQGEHCPFDQGNQREAELRSPIRWLHSIKCPTYVIEGNKDGNASSLQALAKASRNPLCHFALVRGPDHFSVLKRANNLIAEKIKKDDGPTCNIELEEGELNGVFAK